MAAIPLAIVPTPAPLATFMTIGGNLFRIALQQLGDAQQWSRIADANSLSDPWLPSGQIVTLLIPPPLPTSGVTSLSTY
jgi:nucleoid-associated protein YgaU